MGLFDFITKAAEKNQIQAASAREKAYAMSLDELIRTVYEEDGKMSISVRAAYCSELAKKISEMPDNMLIRNYEHFKDGNMNLRQVMGNELVKRNLYENIGPLAYVRK